MTALEIKITKNFMNALLVSEKFDAFLVEDASVTTFNTFEIDGHIVKDFYTSEEIEAAGGALPVFPVEGYSSDLFSINQREKDSGIFQGCTSCFTRADCTDCTES